MCMIVQAWLISFTQQLRTKLPQGTYLLTHARESKLLFTSSLGFSRLSNQLSHLGNYWLQSYILGSAEGL